MDEFYADDKWQREMRDAILVPYYQTFHAGHFELIDPRDPRAKGGCDTIRRGETYDEKIVRWPKDKKTGVPLRAYTAFAFETMSCTVPGRERDGWMVTNLVRYLLYCFANLLETNLNCYRIDFAQLQKWFFAQDLAQWPLWRSEQINRTECRIVPIQDVIANVVGVQRKDIDRPFGGKCECGVPGLYVMHDGFVKTGRQLWYCQDHKPDFRALRMAYFDQHGRWPPVGKP